MHASMPGATLNPDRPDLFAQSILSQAHIEDEQALLQREDHVPRSYSNAFDDAEPLRTVTRLARFLDDDGARAPRSTGACRLGPCNRRSG